MSLVGPRFEYDVFVSYCRGRSAMDGERPHRLRDWSRKLIATIIGETNPPTFGGLIDKVDPVRFYDNPARDNDTLDKADRAAIASSAFMLVVLSPDFAGSAGCCEQIELFLQHAESAGGGRDNALVAMIAPTSLAADGPACLRKLLDGRNRDGAVADYYDRQSLQPLELELSDPNPGFTRLLLEPIGRLANQIRCDLKRLQGIHAASARLPRGERPEPETGADQPPVSPAAPLAPLTKQLYVQGYRDEPAWRRTRDGLRAIAITNPARLVVDEVDLTKRKARDQQRRLEMAQCDGLVLVRAQGDEPTALLASQALKDRRLLDESDLARLEWVLVDWVDDAGPELPADLPLPRIRAREEDWSGAVRRELKL